MSWYKWRTEGAVGATRPGRHFDSPKGGGKSR